ncbi:MULTISPECIES: ferredoxin [unclassified Streptomyces]|uniref:ferredoxin n=1 Tax=unclassified Streptomyces TaxID=2593676 RepID=UPI00096545BF|nr:ferredoxin [Streptomyces sp. TSRI0107]OKJ81217.1 ferredoxin [Streptomyces sp. TSRI0107]
MRIRSNRDTCIGAGRCHLAAPELFDQSKVDATVVVLVDQVTGDRLERAREAVDDCPTRTLRLTED